ncbi:ATP-grasp domain-containing protein [Streptomyces sp. J2-1]|uniref:ATP-grasp domain-containing protein n=1 Tax=Streptomyces corallincola TaxID=2851888 RepID=UPI001C385123|nr:ATP-grasp domain-containing protein [Streptomyces corallincola]MBV2357599.1 ATP-grasp domain-containing protein [Streptomyces corallincola]
MTASLLICCDPLRPRRADPHFAESASAAEELGARVALLDHEALARGRVEEAVAGVPRGLGPLWYRGWMVPGERYAELADALARRGSQLVTGAASYRRAHELPGWYGEFVGVTPRSAWLPVAPGSVPTGQRVAGLAALLGNGPLVVKDYVKSRKHEWDEACYVPDLGDTEQLVCVASKLVEAQGDFLAGGVVLRAFEEFGGPEVRVWWIDGRPVLTGPHPDMPSAPAVDDNALAGEGGWGEVPDAAELERLASRVGALGCRFVTTDLALRTDGVWRVVEVGDGQVSDLSRALDIRLLLEPLLRAGA